MSEQVFKMHIFLTSSGAAGYAERMEGGSPRRNQVLDPPL